MATLRTVGTEALALCGVVASIPLRFLASDKFDPEAPHRTPVVLVHGFLGDPTNFLVAQRYLAAAGIGNVASFSYAPRVDYQRLAVQLGRAVDSLCAAMGASAVDVIGHSLGGLVARYLVEMEPGAPVRRLVTLGAPYFANPLPARELAVFGASDLFIPPPHPAYGPLLPHGCEPRVVVVPECGHWGLLYHRQALQVAAGFLRASDRVELSAPSLALEVAS